MNNHEVPSYYSSRVKMTTLGLRIGSKASWKSNIPAYKPIRIQCKTGSKSASLAFETRAQCQDLMARCKVYIPMKSMVHFATAEPLSLFASPTYLKTKKSENDSRFCGKFLQQSSKNFSDRDDTGTFIVFAIDVRSQVHIIKDRRNGVGKPVFQFVQFG